MVIVIAKQKTNQKFVFKIHSSRLRNSKWDLRLSISEARKNEEVISLSDSEVLRFINDINGISQQEIDNRTNEIKKEIKKLKKLEKSKENSQKIKKLYEELYELQFVSDYVCIIIDKKSDYYRANKGFKINGIKYGRLLGTTGGVKKSVIVYVSEKSKYGKIIRDELKRRIENGRDVNKPLVPAKFEAYQSLVCSSSIPVTHPKGILVVHDCETSFLSDYIELDDSNTDIPTMKYIKNGNIKLIDSDGYGLILPSLSKQWAIDIGESTEEDGDEGILSGYCIRNSWCKGMCFTFDFINFAKEVAKQEIVTDVWGQKHNINDIEMILTTSMLKLWDSYSSLDAYLNNCKKNKYNFSITKACPKELENERSLNYQFIQSYDLTDEEIDKLIAPTVNEIKDVLGEDINKTILFLKGMYLNEKNVDYIEPDFVKALMIDERMINDPFVRQKIYQTIKKRINEAKIGVLKVNGNFSIVSGDPYSLCQSIFGLKVTGLLKKGQIYSKYWNDKGVNKVVGFRAPMTCHNNIRIFNLANDSEMQKWYKYMKTVTIFNSWDTAAHAMNGLDKDSDSILTTDNEILIKNTKELPAIICVQKKAEKKIITEEDLVKANIDSFGDEIGTTTNYITSQFEVQARFPKDSIEYKELDYRIKCGQLYQQNAIDKTKGIVAKSIPREWYDKFANKILPNDTQKVIEKKLFNLRILADKKPYFMNYIYPQQMTIYKKYIDNTNKKSLMEFRLNINDLIAKENKTKREKEFLEYYYSRMPVGISNCIINRICWKIEGIFDRYLKFNPPKEKFDYTILKSNTEYSKNSYNKIFKIYKEYVQNMQVYNQRIKKERIDEEEASLYRNILKQDFKRSCLEICSNEEELCDIVLDICYQDNRFKQFAWDVSGDVIIKNLLRNNDGKIKYIYQDNNGNIEFGGNKFSIGYKKIWGDELLE